MSEDTTDPNITIKTPKPKNKKFNKKLHKTILLVLSALLLFTSGWLVGGNKISLGAKSLSVVSENSSDDLSTDGLQELYDDLKSNYDGQLDNQALIDGLKKGVVAAAGDTYTQYFSVKETEEFNSELNGTFEGIGAELGKEGDFITIIAPIKGAPAEKAGIRPKDIIIKIDGQSSTGITVADAVKKIRGEKGTTVTLTIIRDGEQLEVPIIRDTIDIPSVEHKVEDGVGIIEISRFSDDTTGLVKKAAQEFTDAGIKRIVLDLRGDPGGLLDQAVGVSSVWLPKGSTVLEEKRGGETIKTFTTTDSPILKDVKTVILIDEGSASASEIVSGALKDNGVATLMGTKSYGKGSVQQLINLKSGGSLKVTIARWYTPGGKNIDKEGIEPDVKVERTNDDIKAKKDPQLEAAKQQLK